MLHKVYEICNSKIRYSKKEAKEKRIKNLQFKNPDLRVYQCSVCFDYHLTSSKEFDVEERRRKYPAKIIRKKRFQFIPSMNFDIE